MPTQHHEEKKPLDPVIHALSVLQAQLLAIEAALPREAFRDGTWTAAVRVAWAELVVMTRTSHDLLEATLFLEGRATVVLCRY